MQAPSRGIVFLDVDGVLHGHSTLQTFDPACMLRLQRLIERTGASVVLSSDWRRWEKGREDIAKQLCVLGLPPPVDCTPCTDFASRSDEILDWLYRHPRVQHWVALDDMDLTLAHAGSAFGAHFVQTNRDYGLGDADVERAILILSRPFIRERFPKPRAESWRLRHGSQEASLAVVLSAAACCVLALLFCCGLLVLAYERLTALHTQ